MSILKDIAHNFTNPEDQQSQDILEDLFNLEDEYLKNNSSDFLFGIYQNH